MNRVQSIPYFNIRSESFRAGTRLNYYRNVNHPIRTYVKPLLALITVFLFVGCDQFTKSFAERELLSSGPVRFLSGFVSLQYAQNEGWFLGLGSGLPYEIRASVSIGLTGIVFIGFLILLVTARELTLFDVVAYSLFIAGAMGNLIDRIFSGGRVVDFLVIGTPALHTGIFNGADVFILCGIFGVLTRRLRKPPSYRVPVENEPLDKSGAA